ncbi:MAG: hypothetical protein ACRDBG_16175, partial [Waterburya sp.]
MIELSFKLQITWDTNKKQYEALPHCVGVFRNWLAVAQVIYRLFELITTGGAMFFFPIAVVLLVLAINTVPSVVGEITFLISSFLSAIWLFAVSRRKANQQEENTFRYGILAWSVSALIISGAN